MIFNVLKTVKPLREIETNKKNRTKHEENNLKMFAKYTVFRVLNFVKNKTFEYKIGNKR